MKIVAEITELVLFKQNLVFLFILKLRVIFLIIVFSFFLLSMIIRQNRDGRPGVTNITRWLLKLYQFL